MNRLTRYWGIAKEIGIVLMFVGGAFISYGEYTADEAIHDKDMSIEYTSLKEDNKKILSEVRCIKKELKNIKTDYRLLKLKLFKSNVISDFGGFVTNDDDEIPGKQPKRMAIKEFILSFRNDGWDFLE